MANKELDEDLDLGVENEEGGKKKLYIIMAGVLLLLVASALTAWLLTADQASLAEGEPGAEQQAANKDVVKGPAIYLALEPSFVVNLPPGGSARMLQLGVQVMARNKDTVEFIADNEPMVRHHLIDMFANQRADNLRSSGGKAKLQADVEQTLNGILKNENGPGEVEAVFFTSFVMQ